MGEIQDGISLLPFSIFLLPSCSVAIEQQLNCIGPKGEGGHRAAFDTGPRLGEGGGRGSDRTHDGAKPLFLYVFVLILCEALFFIEGMSDRKFSFS